MGTAVAVSEATAQPRVFRGTRAMVHVLRSQVGRGLKGSDEECDLAASDLGISAQNGHCNHCLSERHSRLERGWHLNLAKLSAGKADTDWTMPRCCQQCYYSGNFQSRNN